MAKNLVVRCVLIGLALVASGEVVSALPLVPLPSERLPPFTLVDPPPSPPPPTTRRFTLGPIRTIVLGPVQTLAPTLPGSSTTTTSPATTTTTTDVPTMTMPTTTATPTTISTTTTDVTTASTDAAKTTTVDMPITTTPTTQPLTTTEDVRSTTSTTTRHPIPATVENTAGITQRASSTAVASSTLPTTMMTTSTAAQWTTTTLLTNAPADNVGTAAPTDLTEPPLPPGAVLEPLALRAAFQLSGTHWSKLTSDAADNAALDAALMADLSVLLGVPTADIVLLAVRDGASGTLIVAFGVSENTGRSAGSLMASFAGAGMSTHWLLNTLDQYKRVAAESVTVVNTGVAFANTPAPTFNPAPHRHLGINLCLYLFFTILVAASHGSV